MNASLILVISVAVLLCGYLVYGRWLAGQWGVDPTKKTPAHRLQDGVDYVPAKAPVLMGHHFSSIAGAGPINGPIQAAVFGWVPVLLWILVGGIFFGGVHDFGALFASVRNDGKSIGEVIDEAMGSRAKKLFLVFSYLTLILVVAAFASIVASTFGNTTSAGVAVEGSALEANLSTACISILFIVLAVIFGIFVYRRNVPITIATVLGIAGIVLIVAIGLNWHPISMSYNTWMIVIAFYIAVASVTPVWILLQPRDYLSSFLLYFMIIVSVIGVIGCTATGNAHLDIPAFTGFTAPASNGLFTTGTLFPALFVTIACGAISGFHSLVSSGTTAKQIDNEKDALVIGYGSMLIECVVAVISLCAVGFVWANASAAAEERVAAGLTSPTAVFAKGVSSMIGTFAGQDSFIVSVAYSMLILAVSVFCLTSLDTATRLARYVFQEFFIGKGETYKDQTGIKRVLADPYVATLITVVLGVGLGLNGYTKIWPLFGAANQLLAALGLMGVCAWLGKIGRNNKMFYVPMVFMLIVTICSLLQTIKAKVSTGDTVQAGIAAVLVVLAVVLAVESFTTIRKQRKQA